jgi:hypothetical protein
MQSGFAPGPDSTRAARIGIEEADDLRKQRLVTSARGAEEIDANIRRLPNGVTKQFDDPLWS